MEIPIPVRRHLYWDRPLVPSHTMTSLWRLYLFSFHRLMYRSLWACYLRRWCSWVPLSCVSTWVLWPSNWWCSGCPSRYLCTCRCPLSSSCSYFAVRTSSQRSSLCASSSSRSVVRPAWTGPPGSPSSCGSRPCCGRHGTSGGSHTRSWRNENDSLWCRSTSGCSWYRRCCWTEELKIRSNTWSRVESAIQRKVYAGGIWVPMEVLETGKGCAEGLRARVSNYDIFF